MILMELRFLGGAREVGKSSVLVNTGKEKFLMDHGIEVQHDRRPIEPPLDLDGVFITHAHIDHSGFVPGLYSRGYQGKTFATPATFDMSHMLLEDSIKVHGKRGTDAGFTSQDIKAMGKRERIMDFRDPQEIGSSTVELFSAGHIPGAAMVSVESRGKRVLYTGDIKFEPTDLMFGADMDIGRCDAVISECTYSYKDHPDRNALKKKLLSIIDETCHNGGVTLLPAFAVGRTQELLVMLRDVEFPVYVDGMGIRAAQRILSHPRSFLNPGRLREAFESSIRIRRNFERKKAVREPSVIITTAGMLQGGPVSLYIEQIAKRKECSMVLTGYQVEETAGRNLLDTGVYDNGEINVKPEFPIHFMDFSAHTDRAHLVKFYKKTSPGKIVLVHGDRSEEFAEELRDQGFDAVAPANGDTLSV
jgi:putative mRNA 3-end processing factor